MQNKRNQNTSLTSGLLLLILVSGIVIGFVVSGGSRVVVRQLDEEQRALYLEQQRELYPIRTIAGNVASIGVIVIVIAAVAGLIAAGAIGLRYLATQAALIYSQDGLFPLLRVGRTIYDPNRDNAGVSTSVTSSALIVQQAAALPRAAKITAKLGDNIIQQQPNELPAPSVELPSRVPLRGLITGAPSLHRLVLGVTNGSDGKRDVVTGDLSQMVHTAVGGSSGWGKSLFLRVLCWQFINAVERPRLALVDLEAVTLSPFSKSKCLMSPMADSVASARDVFAGVVEEINNRKALFSECPKLVDSLDGYNTNVADPLPPLIVVVDEATSLLADRSISSILKEASLRARKYGVWMILAGQDWKSSSLDTAIRNQLGSRFQFRAMSASQARVLMENPGAEAFDVKGRMQAWLPGRPLLTMQAPYIGSDMLMQNFKPRADPDIIDDESLPDDERVRLLAQQGLSKRKIEMRVRHYNGGAASTFVNRVLEDV